MDFTALVATGVPFVAKVLDFIKYLRTGDRNGVVTQAGAWGAGVAFAFLFRASDFSDLVGLNGLNIFSTIIAGFALGSAASLTFDAIDSVRAPRSAGKLKLVGKAEKTMTVTNMADGTSTEVPVTALLTSAPETPKTHVTIHNHAATPAKPRTRAKKSQASPATTSAD